MTRVIAAVVAAFALTLTGCSAPPDQNRKPSYGTTYVYPVALPDGRTVICVESKNGYAGGLSCDWDNAK